MLKLEEIDNYDNAVSYILMIPRFSGKNSIEDTKAFYQFMGEPGSRTLIFHVAGTNGKGSVCAFLNSILRCMGKNVGLFTSPHLVDICERIQINNRLIGKEDFFESFRVIRDLLVQFQNKNTDKQLYHPSFFEFLFFLAMVYFDKNQLDCIILETGLGGRLDATNVIRNVAACIITEIGYDHMEYLGNTLEDIAAEKAGIILPYTPVIFWNKQKETTQVIRRIAGERKAPCISVSKENGDLTGIHNKDIDFYYKSRYYEYVRLSCHTVAIYQIENALLALTAIECIYKKEDLSLSLLQSGISNMRWEGRMEELFPDVYLDGAHNEDGMKAFLHTVSNTYCVGKRYLLFSAVSDKQTEKMAEMIKHSGLFGHIAVARLNSSRGLAIEELTDLFKDYPDLCAFATPMEAFNELLRRKEKEDQVYVAGSLYLVGQIKQYACDMEVSL